MANRIISDLIGTMRTFFRIGTTQIKDNSTVLEAKNKADSAYIPFKASSLRIAGSSSGEVQLNVPAAAAGTYELPDDDGTTGQVLSTDGSGKWSWATVATSNNTVLSHTEAVVHNSSTPIAVFTPPANSVILSVIADVDTAFDADGCNLSVGVAGTTSRYLGTTDVDLSLEAVFEVNCMYQEDASPEEIIITFSAGTSGTEGSAHVTITYANPS